MQCIKKNLERYWRSHVMRARAAVASSHLDHCFGTRLDIEATAVECLGVGVGGEGVCEGSRPFRLLSEIKRWISTVIQIDRDKAVLAARSLTELLNGFNATVTPQGVNYWIISIVSVYFRWAAALRNQLHGSEDTEMAHQGGRDSAGEATRLCLDKIHVKWLTCKHL